MPRACDPEGGLIFPFNFKGIVMKLHSRHAATAGPVAGLRTKTAENFASAKPESAMKATTAAGHKKAMGAGTGPQHGLLQV